MPSVLAQECARRLRGYPEMRLDQIILNRGVATLNQIQEALDYQKLHGGRLETHLFRFGYVDEANLAAALSEQFGCPPVALNGLSVPPETLSLIPAETAWTWLALPFAYDAASETVRVACECSRKDGLKASLETACPGKKFELHIALGVTLQLALIRHYRAETAVQDLEFPSTDVSGESISVPIESFVSISARCGVLICEDAESGVPAIGPMLNHQGFLVKTARNVDELAEAFTGAKPDIMILVESEGPDGARRFVGRLAERGISVLDCPTYLVISSVVDSEIGELLDMGFEDVIRVQNILDLLMIKLRRLKDRLVTQRNERLEILQALGTHGSLQDMNVIDLLQAMGTTGKTACISVSGKGRQLTAYLERGRIVYAECDVLIGPEAVYAAVGWDQGVWNVDPIKPEELPEPNVFSSNEAILLEGCRRLDEMTRGDAPRLNESDAFFLLDSLT